MENRTDEYAIWDRGIKRKRTGWYFLLLGGLVGCVPGVLVGTLMYQFFAL